MKTTTTTKTIDHPLDAVFDIVPHSTTVEYTTIVPSEVIDMPNYDDKDNDIETKIEQVYAMAMSSVTALVDDAELVEGKYKARMGEVTATMLSVALGAIREQSQLKMHKDKILLDTKGSTAPHTVNQNLIVTDRNEILRMLQNKSE
jgi:hypothetical protein